MRYLKVVKEGKTLFDVVTIKQCAEMFGKSEAHVRKKLSIGDMKFAYNGGVVKLEYKTDDEDMLGTNKLFNGERDRLRLAWDAVHEAAKEMKRLSTRRESDRSSGVYGNGVHLTSHSVRFN